MSTMREESYWQAVLDRDSGSDGAFVYGVRSTGIYCRPSCPSRRPGRAQVRFFEVPEAAEEAGFRPCLRCRPRKMGRPEHLVEPVRQACRYIEANLDRSLTLSEVSAEVALSPYHLQRTFKRVMGITPRQYAEARRLDNLKTQLREGQSVTTALYDVGYSSSSRLYERAPEQLGMTPSAYRKGGAGMHVGYTIVDSPLGRLLVGATERGVCAVSLGDSDGYLEAALRREYPAAEVQHDQAGLDPWVGVILGYLDGTRPDLDLPLDVQATAFQWRVWEALRAIPYGSTRSYGEVARAVGEPNAARAVAMACASNPVALVVPCHRVIGQSGKLSGYRWGAERKRLLLEKESAGAQSDMVPALAAAE
jgi:AraC family transcriptional regulator of adaptative response/methylated-DNA-[protein]-cysteine methyltransferase